MVIFFSFFHALLKLNNLVVYYFGCNGSPLVLIISLITNHSLYKLVWAVTYTSKNIIMCIEKMVRRGGDLTIMARAGEVLNSSLSHKTASAKIHFSY